MKRLLFFFSLSLAPLAAQNRGSLHDAWSDWMQKKQVEQPKDIERTPEIADDSCEAEETEQTEWTQKA